MAETDDVFFLWRDRVLKLIRKDSNLGPYGWNAKELVDIHSNEVLWSNLGNSRDDYNKIIWAAEKMNEAAAMKVKPINNSTLNTSTISDSPGTPIRPKGTQDAGHIQSGKQDDDRPRFKLAVEEDGTLVRDGNEGDMVAFIIEHEGIQVMKQNAKGKLSFRYSSDLKIRAWITDMETYQPVLSNVVEFEPGLRTHKYLTPGAELKIQGKDLRDDMFSRQIEPKVLHQNFEDLNNTSARPLSSPLVPATPLVPQPHPTSSPLALTTPLPPKPLNLSGTSPSTAAEASGVSTDHFRTPDHNEERVLELESELRAKESELKEKVMGFREIEDEHASKLKEKSDEVQHLQELLDVAQQSLEMGHSRVRHLEQEAKKQEVEFMKMFELSKEHERKSVLEEQQRQFAETREAEALQRERELRDQLHQIRRSSDQAHELEVKRIEALKMELEDKVQDLELALRRSEDSEAELKEKYESSMASLNTKIKGHCEEIAAAHARADALQQQLQSAAAASSASEEAEGLRLELQRAMEDLLKVEALSSQSKADHAVDKDTLERTRVQLEETKERVKELEGLLAIAEGRCQESEFQSLRTEENIAQVQKVIESIWSEATTLEDKLVSAGDQMEEMKKALHLKAQGTVASLQTLNASLAHRVEHTAEGLGSVVAQLSVLSDDFVSELSLQEQLEETFQSQLRSLDGGAEEAQVRLGETVERHERKLKALEAAHEQALQVLRDGHSNENSALKSRIKSLEDSLEDKQAEVLELEDALAELEEEKHLELQKVKHEYDLEILELRARLQSAEDLVKFVTKDLDEQKLVAISTSQALTPLLQDRSVAESEASSLRKQISEMQAMSDTQLRVKTNRVKELEVALSKSRDSLKKLRGETRRLSRTPASARRKESSDPEPEPIITTLIKEGSVESDSEDKSTTIARLSRLLGRMEEELAVTKHKAKAMQTKLLEVYSECPDVFARAGLIWMNPWPIWLRGLSLCSYLNLLPRINVGATETVKGVVHYGIEVSHDCDIRGSWSIPKRFSAICALHESLMREIPTYALSPIVEGGWLIAEKRKSPFGSGQKAIERRLQLLNAFFRRLSQTVEILASRSLQDFLEMSSNFVTQSSIANVISQPVVAEGPRASPPDSSLTVHPRSLTDEFDKENASGSSVTEEDWQVQVAAVPPDDDIFETCEVEGGLRTRPLPVQHEIVPEEESSDELRMSALEAGAPLAAA